MAAQPAFRQSEADAHKKRAVFFGTCYYMQAHLGTKQPAPDNDESGCPSSTWVCGSPTLATSRIIANKPISGSVNLRYGLLQGRQLRIKLGSRKLVNSLCVVGSFQANLPRDRHANPGPGIVCSQWQEHEERGNRQERDGEDPLQPCTSLFCLIQSAHKSRDLKAVFLSQPN